jgi:hypothetical protein
MELDVTDPEFVLEWPKEIFKAETLSLLRRHDDPTDAFEFLLEEAFAGSTPANQFRKEIPFRPWAVGENPSSTEQVARNLIELYNSKIDALRGPLDRIPYWPERRLPDEPKKVAENLHEAWCLIVNDLVEAGYFYRDVQPCVDGLSPDEYASRMEEKILRTARLEVKWPLESDKDPIFKDENLFYGLVECLADLVARPRARRWHDYGDCGWHYSDFYLPTGLAVYAWKVNALFKRFGLDLALETQGDLRGRLVRTTDAPRQDLVERAGRSTDDSISGRVASAVDQYRKRDATAHDKRSACITLAGILENRRTLLKEKLLREDERALFQIANQFDIRHNGPGQKREYSEEFLDWIFWWYLATVDLTETILERETEADLPSSEMPMTT